MHPQTWTDTHGSVCASVGYLYPHMCAHRCASVCTCLSLLLYLHVCVPVCAFAFVCACICMCTLCVYVVCACVCVCVCLSWPGLPALLWSLLSSVGGEVARRHLLREAEAQEGLGQDLLPHQELV